MKGTPILRVDSRRVRWSQRWLLSLRPFWAGLVMSRAADGRRLGLCHTHLHPMGGGAGIFQSRRHRQRPAGRRRGWPHPTVASSDRVWGARTRTAGAALTSRRIRTWPGGRWRLPRHQSTRCLFTATAPWASPQTASALSAPSCGPPSRNTLQVATRGGKRHDKTLSRRCQTLSFTSPS